jgi:four helix bundle protein
MIWSGIARLTLSLFQNKIAISIQRSAFWLTNMKNFRELKVWEKAHQLTLAAYQATTAFPQEELYGLTSQMRRSAASIPTNIAEGCGRGSDDDFRRFLQIAMGSASELEYQLLLAHDLGYFDTAERDRLSSAVVEVKRMLASLITKIRNDH